MPLRRNWLVVGCTVGLASMLLLVSASSALASASVRFVHAVPGAGPATLNVSVDGAGVSTAPVSFGTVSPPLQVAAGAANMNAVPAAGGDALAKADQTLEDDTSYTVVALPKKGGKGAQLRIYRAGKPKKGEALIRVIHAGAELGDPDVRVGKSVVAEKVAYGDATGYVDVPPGTNDVSVTRAGGKGGPLATKAGVPLTAGTATTAVIVGSGGEPTRILTISDGTAAPAGAPATGFGGLADGGGLAGGRPSRLAVGLLAALAAGALGAGGWTLTGRR
jgi:hypothetical protein